VRAKREEILELRMRKTHMIEENKRERRGREEEEKKKKGKKMKDAKVVKPPHSPPQIQKKATKAPRSC
jgi:hypothetical protein